MAVVGECLRTKATLEGPFGAASRDQNQFQKQNWGKNRPFPNIPNFPKTCVPSKKASKQAKVLLACQLAHQLHSTRATGCGRLRTVQKVRYLGGDEIIMIIISEIGLVLVTGSPVRQSQLGTLIGHYLATWARFRSRFGPPVIQLCRSAQGHARDSHSPETQRPRSHIAQARTPPIPYPHTSFCA